MAEQLPAFEDTVDTGDLPSFDQTEDVSPRSTASPDAGQVKKWGPFTYDPSKNDFKNNPIGTLADMVFGTGNHQNDPEAKAMLSTFGYPGGLVSDAGIEALKRLAGQGGLGAEEWGKALRGNATPATQQLEKAGYGPLASYGIGLPYAAITDPLASFIGPASEGVPKGSAIGALKEATAGSATDPQNIPTILQALSQTRPGAGQGSAVNQPVGSAIQALGRKIYGLPFKKADAELATKWRNSGSSAHPLTDTLWNEGNPLVGGFSKTNPEIGEQIVNQRKQTGADIGNRIAEAGGDDEIHLAPDLVENAKEEMPAPEGHDEEELIGDPDEIEEPSDEDAISWLKGQIASRNKDARARGIQILADSVPELGDVITGNAKHLANSGTRDGMISFYHGLIDDLSEGPRSLEGLQDLKVSLQNLAARNQQMGANQYARNALPNVGKTADMQAASQLGQVIDGIVDEHLGTNAVSSADKARYSALRRGEVPALRAVQSAQTRRPLGTLGTFVLGEGLMHGLSTGDWMGALSRMAAGAATKGGDYLVHSPRAATGTGMLLNQAGKSNLWDTMIRRGMLNSALQNQGGNQ